MATHTRVLRSQAVVSERPSSQFENAEVDTSRVPSTHEEMPSAALEKPLQQKETTVPESARDSNDGEDDPSENESDNGQPRKEYPDKPERARSLDSANRSRQINPVYFKSSTLSTEQEKAVEAANESLTTEQKERIATRQEKVARQHESTEVQAESSRNKGKTVDPREWGNARLNSQELDIEVQKALLEAYEEGQKQAREIIDDFKNKMLTENNETFEMPSLTRHKSIAQPDLVTRRAGSRPAAQIVPNSSLGVALGKIAKIADKPDGPDDPDHSSSGYSSDYSRSSRSQSRSRSRRRHRRRSKRRSKGRSRHRRKSSRKSGNIKPIAPKDYDGEPNARAYHRFVMEGEAYLRDGKVTRERQIRILAHYLDGKAYDFYMQKVASDDPNNWTLHKFFMELFNYCFPLDYRQQMRLKLESSYQQSNQTVSEYVFELQEMFSMVGTMPIEMKVIKLWHSLKAKIQQAMW